MTHSAIDEPLTIPGRGRVSWGSEAHDAILALDAINQCIHARYHDDSMRDPANAFWALTGGAPDDITLTDVQFDSSIGALSLTQISELYVRQRRIYEDGECDGQVPTRLKKMVHLILVPKLSRLEFSGPPAIDHELVYVGNSSEIYSKPFVVDGVEYHVANDGARLNILGTAPYIRITASADLLPLERRVRLAVSVLLGIRMGFAMGSDGHKVFISLADAAKYQNGHPLCEQRRGRGEILECLMSFFLKLSPDQLDHWYRACAFFIEGKSSHVEIDIRVINLLIFLEMIDTTDEMHLDSIAATLEISLSDAKLIKGVRNRLVHGRHGLHEAIREADKHLRAYDPKYSLRHFDVSEKHQQIGAAFYLRLCERANRYICRQISWNKGHYDYAHLLGGT